jgi:hypothetical protein
VATRIRDLLVKIRADSVEVDRELQRAGRSLERFGGRMNRVGRTLTLGLTVPILGAGAAALKTASDAEETQQKFDSVFKQMAGSVGEWAGEQATALGRSQTELKGYLARLQDTFVPLGFARRQAADYSKTLTALALDVAAFNNEADEETLRNFTSAIVGNHEAVRRYGVVITQATLKAELFRMGITGGVLSATEQEKALARLNILTRQTADAHGTAAREAGNFAGGFKGLIASGRDFAEFVGSQMIPFVNELQRRVTGFVRRAAEADSGTVRWAIALAGVAAVAGPLVLVVGKLVVGVGALATALSVGMLPLIAVGGPILIGLGLLAAAFAKTRLDAASARAEVDNFGASLRSMGEAELRATQATIAAKGAELKRDIAQQERLLATPGLGRTTTRQIERRIIALRTQLGTLTTSAIEVHKALAALLAGGEGDGGDGATSGLSKVPKILQDVEDRLRVIRDIGEIFGGAGTAAERVGVLRKAVQDLLEEGLRPSDEAVRSMLARLRQAQVEAIPAFFGAGLPVPGDQLGRRDAGTRDLLPFGLTLTPQVNEAKAAIEDALFATQRWKDVGLSFALQFGDALADFATDGVEAFRRFAEGAIRQLARIAAHFAIFSLFKGILGPTSPFVDALGKNLGFRAAGGPVMPNRAYFVGEQGMELFVPHTAGRIVSNQELGGGAGAGSRTLNVHLPPADDPRVAARERGFLLQLAHGLRELGVEVKFA